MPEVTRTQLQLLDISVTSLPAYSSTTTKLRSAAPRPKLELVEEEKPYWELRDPLENRYGS
jgi:phage head maturation protease